MRQSYEGLLAALKDKDIIGTALRHTKPPYNNSLGIFRQQYSTSLSPIHETVNEKIMS